jgi:hypothetical protein
MGMNRRGFLGALLGGAAALALDPEKLLWRPGAKLISIPSSPFDDEHLESVHAQILLRMLNEYTPFASYVGKISYPSVYLTGQSVTSATNKIIFSPARRSAARFGMGDYVPTSFVVPQGLRTANEHLTALWPFAGGNERALLVAEVTDCPVR